jgi:hypothetical protein
MYRTVVIAALLFGVVAGAACGDDDDDGGRAQRSTTTASTTTTAPTPEAAVETAYLAYKDLRARLLEAPDAGDPEIAQWATGAAEDRLVESLTMLEAEGRAVRFGPDYAVVVLSVSLAGASAELMECFVDDADVIDVASEEVVGESEVATVLNRVTLLAGPGGWQVIDIVQEDGWEGVSDCSD